jgi:hypothetical protein
MERLMMGDRRSKALLVLFFIVSLPVMAQEASLNEPALLKEKQDNIRALEIELLELKIQQQKSQFKTLQDKQPAVVVTDSEQNDEVGEVEKIKQEHQKRHKKIKIRLGMSVGLMEDFEAVDTISSAGKMYTSSKYTPYFELQSPYLYFSKKNKKNRMGVYLDFSIRKFDFSRQEVGYKNFFDRTDNFDGDIVNLGTRVKGEMAQLSTVIFFNPSRNKETNISMIFGAGLGISYINAQGNIVITENVFLPTNELLDVNVNDSGLYFKLLADAQMDNWFATALLQISSADEEGIAFSYVGLAFNVGYSFEL